VLLFLYEGFSFLCWVVAGYSFCVYPVACTRLRFRGPSFRSHSHCHSHSHAHSHSQLAAPNQIMSCSTTSTTTCNYLIGCVRMLCRRMCDWPRAISLFFPRTLLPCLSFAWLLRYFVGYFVGYFVLEDGDEREFRETETCVSQDPI